MQTLKKIGFIVYTGTTIKQATKSGELPPQPSKPQPQQQAPPQAALAVPQVAICPATPAVNETDQQASIVSSQQKSSSSTVMSSSSSVTTVQQGGGKFSEKETAFFKTRHANFCGKHKIMQSPSTQQNRFN